MCQCQPPQIDEVDANISTQQSELGTSDRKTETSNTRVLKVCCSMRGMVHERCALDKSMCMSHVSRGMVPERCALDK